MSKKTTWMNIRDDFRRRHPRLSKQVVDFRPYDYMTIVIYLKDGRSLLYDGIQKRAIFIRAA